MRDGALLGTFSRVARPSAVSSSAPTVGIGGSGMWLRARTSFPFDLARSTMATIFVARPIVSRAEATNASTSARYSA